MLTQPLSHITFYGIHLAKPATVKFTLLLTAPATIPALQAEQIMCSLGVRSDNTAAQLPAPGTGSDNDSKGLLKNELHQPSRMGQEVPGSVAKLPFAENFRNFMRMHTDFQDDVTSSLM